jgi:DNA ligase D-like protein (predicted ligase)
VYSVNVKATRTKVAALPIGTAEFIAPMECLSVPKLPEDPQWVWEIKLGGYRALGVKGRETILYSRNGKNFNKRFPQIAEAIRNLPANTVIDGEVVALDDSGRPDFHRLQHFTAERSRIRYFVFDLIILRGRDLTGLPMSERRELMKTFKLHSPRIRLSEQFHISGDDMLAAVRKQQLEGVIGKRKDSLYEAGKRTGAWVKMRINKAQEFVIGGFVPGPHGVDSLIVGYYRGKDLMYVARVRNGFVPASRRHVFQKLRHLVSPKMPFANLPDEHPSRWGESLTAEKMKECFWLRPEVVAQIEFLEWTDADRLRHSKFVGLRDDKNPREVVKEV